MSNHNFNFLASLIMLIAISAAPTAGLAQTQFELTATLLNGDTPTGQNGTNGSISSLGLSFNNERITDAGVFANLDLFGGNVTADTNEAIGFTPGGVGNAQILAQEGQTAPGGSETFRSLTDPIANNRGDVAFIGELNDAVGDNVGVGFFFYDSASSGLVQIARVGTAIPEDPGATFSSVGLSDDPVINDSGQVLYTAGTTGGLVGDAEGVFLFDSATNTSTTIVRGGPGPAVSGGTFGLIEDDSLFLNNAGSGGFVAELEGSASETRQALITFGSNRVLLVTAQEGDAAPGGDFFGGASRTFDDDEISVSDTNQMVFQSALADSDGTNIGEGLFFDTDITSPGQLQAFLRTGDTVTFGNVTGVVDTIGSGRSIQLNEAGQFAFAANIDTGSLLNDDFLLIGDINNPGSFTVLAREGDPAGENGAFFDSSFDADININEAGQALFMATSLDNDTGGTIGTSRDTIILFYDPTLGLLTVVQEGDASSNGTIGGLTMEEVALRDDGSFIFEFFLGTDNGIALGSLLDNPFILGDVNMDGVVDFLDISPFITLLATGEFKDEADINRDNAVTFLDISPFIILLSSQ